MCFFSGVVIFIVLVTFLTTVTKFFTKVTQGRTFFGSQFESLQSINRERRSCRNTGLLVPITVGFFKKQRA